MGLTVDPHRRKKWIRYLIETIVLVWLLIAGLIAMNDKLSKQLDEVDITWEELKR